MKITSNKRPVFWAWIAVAPLLVFLGVLFFFPVLSLLGISFGEDQLTFEHYLRIGEVPIYRRVLLNTFVISALVTLLCVIVSYPVAYLLATVSPKVRKILFIVVLLPFWTSALVRTTAWIILLQRKGVLNDLLTGAGLIDEPIAFVYNLSGVLIGMTHVLMPFVVLPLFAAFINIDRTLIEAAEGLGAGPYSIGRRVIMPLTAPGVIAGATIVFLNSIGYYITPALMGGPGQTMIAMLIADNINRDLNWSLAAALSVVLLLCTVAIFVVFQRVFGLERLLTGSASRGSTAKFSIGNNGRTGGGWLTFACGVAVLIFLIAPILIVFPMSLGSSPFLSFPPESYSLRWFHNLFEEAKWMRGVFNSLQAAAVAVSFSVVLGTLAAIGTMRLGRRMRPWLETVFILPMVIPVIILSVGLFYMLAPLGVIGNPATLGLAHSVLAVPYVFITVRASLVGFDRNLELAALNLGASWPVMFRRIMLPAIMPGVAAGAVFAFIQSFDDVVLALFLTNIRSRTLPRVMFEGMVHEIDPTIIAASAMIIMLTLTLLAINLILSRRQS
ncbi:ABC transporter permease subunit [Nitratireductor sp. B36]|uniref:ABC transporter permease subunit n=1 Tax=Nitratireductor sp. B36 TaxID=2762059 RepID=UPI001E5902A5|nr:ABC transporter permease subunit [Nitratireductor sp. B36]MCC5780984.1 ABC transporter permease subunit [Nitratireductor sp. B36]